MPEYSSNPVPGLIQANECVFVIVDVQERLLPAIQDKKQVEENIVRLVRFCSIMDIPVQLCEQVNLGNTVGPIKQEIDDVRPIEKETFDCFGSTPFREALGASGKKTLILAGIETHVCVLQTAISAVARGYQVQVVMDATSSRAKRNADLARDRFLQSGVTLSSTEMFIFEALQRAKTEEFRQTLPLIR